MFSKVINTGYKYILNYHFSFIVPGRRIRNLDTNGIPTTIEEFNNGTSNLVIFVTSQALVQICGLFDFLLQ